MATGPNLSSLSSQIKTHRKHHEEPGNLTALIISFPRVPCGTQDTPLSFGLVGILRGVWEKKKEKSQPVSAEAGRKRRPSHEGPPAPSFSLSQPWSPRLLNDLRVGAIWLFKEEY